MAHTSSAGKGRFVCVECKEPFFALPPIESDQTCPNCGHVARYEQRTEPVITHQLGGVRTTYVSEQLFQRISSFPYELPTRESTIEEKLESLVQRMKAEILGSTNEFNHLLGEIFATLRINLDRGTLPKELEPLLLRWSDRHHQITGSA